MRTRSPRPKSISRQDLATKEYLDYRLTELERRLEKSVAETKFDMIKWLLASQGALVATLIALANFTRLFGR